MQGFAAAAGMNPQSGLLISREALNQAKGNQDLDKGQADIDRENKENTPSNWTNPATNRNYTLYGNTMLPSRSDAEIASEAQSKADAVA